MMAVEKGSWSSAGSSSAATLKAVVALDPRPDTVEDVLNVCPQQASGFGKQKHKPLRTTIYRVAATVIRGSGPVASRRRP